MPATVETSERFFLHYAPHSDFEHGIFVPFATQLEAERQAAWDLATGMDPDFIESIFKAPYAQPKFGWLSPSAGHVAPELRASAPVLHLDKANRKAVLSKSRIVKAAPKHVGRILDEMQRGAEEHIREIHRKVLTGENLKLSVPGEAFTVMTGGTATAGPVALSATTAKTVVGVLAGSTTPPSISQMDISFDGVSASAVPVLCEIVIGTNASNAPGTNSTSQTLQQLRGWPAAAAISSSGYNWTAEPTVLTVVRKFLLTPNGGLIVVQSPLGRELSALVTASTAGKFVGIRLTAPATVNVHITLEVEE